MMSSDRNLRERAEAAVAQMAAHLDEGYLYQCIDEPIDHAAASFVLPDDPELSFRGFHTAVTRFVAHVHAHGLPCRRVLSTSQARDEAVMLLESCYQGTRERGLDGAFLDAISVPSSGLPLVLARLTEALKGRERWLRTQWVAGAFFDPLDWELRCEIAAVLWERYAALLPGIPACDGGARFADAIPTLLDSCIKADLLPHRTAISRFSFIA